MAYLRLASRTRVLDVIVRRDRTVVIKFKSAMTNPLELRPDQVSDGASFLEFVRSLVNERDKLQ
jgi:hypothetical protein